jgi:hypothetical protein
MMAKLNSKSWIASLFKKVLTGLLLGAGTLSCAALGGLFAGKMEGVDLTGIHHLGTSFKIDEFYANGTYGGNVGWEGGGGSITCCVELPSKWRPGLTGMVRWSVSDWSQKIPAETAKGNYRSVLPAGSFRARIPVEKYGMPEHLYVHFFAGGKARAVSSAAGKGIYHPIADNDPNAADQATPGTRVDELFTGEELAEMDRKAKEHTKRYGDWR